MIYTELPEGRTPKVDVVSIFVQVGAEILLLKRHPNDSEPNKYGPPGGKVNANEGLLAAMIRELYEETGIARTSDELQHHRTIFVEYPLTGHIIRYHMFTTRISEKPDVRLSPKEHTEYVWCTPRDALKLPLMFDEDACISLHFFPRTL